jgi:hypothetical protein
MKNPNGPSIEQVDDWNDALADQEAVLRKLDEQTVADYKKLAGPLFGVAPVPAFVAAAVRRLQSQDDLQAKTVSVRGNQTRG